jgi:signal transduction histidine kinase
MAAGAELVRKAPDEAFLPHSRSSYFVALAVSVVPILFRRTMPRVALLIVAIDLIACWQMDVRVNNATVLAMYVICYSQAAYPRRRTGWLGPIVLTASISVFLPPSKVGWAELLIVGGLLTAAALAGDAAWQTRRVWSILDDLCSDAEERGALLERRAVLGERQRIAVDTDAVVRRATATIAAHARRADEALLVGDGDGPAELEAVASSARTALAELRHLLGVLRDDQPALAVAPREPRPPVALESRAPSWLRRPPVVDGLASLALALFIAWDIREHGEHLYLPHVGNGAVAMGVAIAMCVLLRRRPWVALIAATALEVAQIGVLNLRWSDGVSLVIMLLVFGVARSGSRWQAFAATVVAIGAALPFMDRTHWVAFVWILTVGTYALAAAAGQIVRQRGLANDALAQRIDVIDSRAEMAAEVAAAEERLRIAREMHDVVAHALSLIAVQAAGAAAIAPTSTARAREATGAVLDAAASAEHELDSLLGVLDEGGVGPQHLTIDELIETHRGAGLHVDLAVVGSPATNDAMDVTTFRIVQEALTNVTKHAPGADVTVTLRYAPTGVDVVVTNTTPPWSRQPSDPGYGLHGMRERVAARGGTLDAGPLAGGGWKVEAFLPNQLALA